AYPIVVRRYSLVQAAIRISIALVSLIPRRAKAIEHHTRTLSESAPSGQLGNQLLELGLGPGSGGAAPHVAERTERERTFSDVVPIVLIDEEPEIAVAGVQIVLLDLDSDFLGEFLGDLAALGSILHCADTRVGPA